MGTSPLPTLSHAPPPSARAGRRPRSELLGPWESRWGLWAPPPAPQDQHHRPHPAPPTSAKSLLSLSLGFLSCKVDKARVASGRFHDARQVSPRMHMAFRGAGLQKLKVQQGRWPRARAGEPACSVHAPDMLRRTRAIRGCGTGPGRLESSRWVSNFHTVTVLLNLNLMCFWNP